MMSVTPRKRTQKSLLQGLKREHESDQNNELASGMFSVLENDKDFMLVAERWPKLSEELRQAVLRLVK